MSETTSTTFRIPSKTELGLPEPRLDWEPNDSVTGRDGYIVAKALAYAIDAIEAQPRRWQEWSDCQDMKAILATIFGSSMCAMVINSARLHLSHGKRRVFEPLI
jgi:hypothetical protein